MRASVVVLGTVLLLGLAAASEANGPHPDCSFVVLTNGGRGLSTCPGGDGPPFRYVVVALRRDLHAHPELGFEERRTAGRVAEMLASAGNLSIQTGVAKTGVVAVLNADKPGRCLAIRGRLLDAGLPDQGAVIHDDGHRWPWRTGSGGCQQST